MEEKTESKMYCPICNGPVEETGKPAWAYCRTHGWVKYKSRYEKESEDLVGKPSSKGEGVTEPGEEEVSFTIRRSPLLRYIVPAVAVTALLGLLVGYFFWKDTRSKNVEVGTQLPRQKNEQSVEQPQSQKPVTVKEAAPPNKEEKKEIGAEKKSKSRKPRSAKQFSQIHRAPQTQGTRKSPKPAFTVQAGAFRDASRAQSLKTMLHKKGYVTSIVSSKSKEGGTLYKVFVGSFRDKKEAENISREIGKKEGIQAFVRVK
jgi:cell division septation protein DedD